MRFIFILLILSTVTALNLNLYINGEGMAISLMSAIFSAAVMLHIIVRSS